MDDETIDEKTQVTEADVPVEDFAVPAEENVDINEAESVVELCEELMSAPAPNNNSAVSSNSKTEEKKQNERKGLNALATEFSLEMYRFAASIRKKGHATLADMVFRDSMLINITANTASNAIGRDRFIECLEDGYYASGRVTEYLKFAALCEAGGPDIGTLMDKAETIHKIYAVSIKTATGKNRKGAGIYM